VEGSHTNFLCTGEVLNSGHGIGAAVCYRVEKVPSSRESLFIPLVAMENTCFYTSLKPEEWNCVNSGTGIQNTFQTDVTGISIVVRLAAVDWITKLISVFLNPPMACKSAQWLVGRVRRCGGNSNANNIQNGNPQLPINTTERRNTASPWGYVNGKEGLFSEQKVDPEDLMPVRTSHLFCQVHFVPISLATGLMEEGRI